VTLLTKTLHRAHLSQDVVLEGNVLLVKGSAVLVGSQRVYQRRGKRAGNLCPLQRTKRPYNYMYMGGKLIQIHTKIMHKL